MTLVSKINRTFYYFEFTKSTNKERSVLLMNFVVFNFAEFLCTSQILTMECTLSQRPDSKIFSKCTGCVRGHITEHSALHCAVTSLVSTVKGSWTWPRSLGHWAEAAVCRFWRQMYTFKRGCVFHKGWGDTCMKCTSIQSLGGYICPDSSEQWLLWWYHLCLFLISHPRS